MYMTIGPHMGLTRAEREECSVAKLLQAAVFEKRTLLEPHRKLSDCVGLITGQRVASAGAYLIAGDAVGSYEKRDLTVGVASAGGYAVDTSIGSWAESLVRQSLVGSLSVQRLQNMQSSVVITDESVRTGAGFVTEAGTAPSSESTYNQAAMTPKIATGSMIVSRQLMLQMGPAAGPFMEAGLRTKMAEAVDSALLFGSGVGGNPMGIALAVGVDTRTGAAFTFANANAMLKVCDGYALGDSTVWVGGVGAAEVCRNRERAAGSGFIADGGRIAGKPLLVSRGVPDASLTVTEWGKVWFADWGALEILIDPYTHFKTGRVIIMGRWLIDVAVQRPSLVATATAVS